MNTFEKIKERLGEYRKDYKSGLGEFTDELVDRVMRNTIAIVSEVEAEYGNPKTNADRIRAMSDEELAEFLAETELHGSQGSYKDYLDWLKSPTTD